MKPSNTRKRVERKGWIYAVGLSSRERRKIKFYLTKKRALDGDKYRAKYIYPAKLIYSLPTKRTK